MAADAAPTIQLRRGNPLGLLPFLGCAVLPLTLFAMTLVVSLAGGRYLFATVILIPIVGFVLALGDPVVRRAVTAAIGEGLLLVLFGRVSCRAEVGGPEPHLWVGTRLGPLRVTRRRIPWSQVVRIDASVAQGGYHHLCVEEVDGQMTFFGHFDEPRAEQTAAVLSRWREDALADAVLAAPCVVCGVPLCEPTIECEGCAGRVHCRCARRLGACPTADCPGTLGAPAARDDALLFPAPLRRRGERVGLLMFPAWALVAGLLLVSGLATGDGAELFVAIVLAGLTWPPVIGGRGELLEELLPTPRVLRRSGPAVRLELRWRLGRLTLAQIELARITGVEVRELGTGFSTVRICCGQREHVVARETSVTAARRAQEAIEAWIGDGSRESSSAASTPS